MAEEKLPILRELEAALGISEKQEQGSTLRVYRCSVRGLVPSMLGIVAYPGKDLTQLFRESLGSHVEDIGPKDVLCSLVKEFPEAEEEAAWELAESLEKW